MMLEAEETDLLLPKSLIFPREISHEMGRSSHPDSRQCSQAEEHRSVLPNDTLLHSFDAVVFFLGVVDTFCLFLFFA